MKKKVRRPTSKKGGSRQAGFHIGQTPVELALFEFQHSAICFIEAFYHHIERQLILITGDPNLSAQDLSLIHI